MEPQVDADDYLRRDYDTKARFCSYWHQIDEALRLNPERILEVGLGNGFVSEYLRRRQVSQVTIDIDPELNPDVVGSVLRLPFVDEAFDVITCNEVLEHIPYPSFSKALSEIHRASRSHAILSLPDDGHNIRFDLRLRNVGDFGRAFRFPRLRRPVHLFDGQHHWEIGKASYPLSRIVKDIESEGFSVARTYCVPENPWHRFFILDKVR